MQPPTNCTAAGPNPSPAHFTCRTTIGQPAPTPADESEWFAQIYSDVVLDKDRWHVHGNPASQNPHGLHALPRPHPRRPATDRNTHGIDHWRAGCRQTGTSGSAGAARKRTREQREPRRAAYPTVRFRMEVASSSRLGGNITLIRVSGLRGLTGLGAPPLATRWGAIGRRYLRAILRRRYQLVWVCGWSGPSASNWSLSSWWSA
jgi:hypothetical protein